MNKDDLLAFLQRSPLVHHVQVRDRLIGSDRHAPVDRAIATASDVFFRTLAKEDLDADLVKRNNHLYNLTTDGVRGVSAIDGLAEVIHELLYVNYGLANVEQRRMLIRAINDEPGLFIGTEADQLLARHEVQQRSTTTAQRYPSLQYTGHQWERDARLASPDMQRPHAQVFVHNIGTVGDSTHTYTVFLFPEEWLYGVGPDGSGRSLEHCLLHPGDYGARMMYYHVRDIAPWFYDTLLAYGEFVRTPPVTRTYFLNMSPLY